MAHINPHSTTTVDISHRPTKVNEGQRRPTRTQRGPTTVDTANEGPSKVNTGQHRTMQGAARLKWRDTSFEPRYVFLYRIYFILLMFISLNRYIYHNEGWRRLTWPTKPNTGQQVNEDPQSPTLANTGQHRWMRTQEANEDTWSPMLANAGQHRRMRTHEAQRWPTQVNEDPRRPT